MKIKVTSPHAAKAMEVKWDIVYDCSENCKGILKLSGRTSTGQVHREQGLQGRKYFTAGEQWWWNEGLNDKPKRDQPYFVVDRKFVKFLELDERQNVAGAF